MQKVDKKFVNKHRDYRQFNCRIPPKLMAKVKARAGRELKTLQDIGNEALEQYVAPKDSSPDISISDEKRQRVYDAVSEAYKDGVFDGSDNYRPDFEYENMWRASAAYTRLKELMKRL